MTTRHVIPATLWKAAREHLKLDQATRDHLASCAECTTLWAAIRQFPQAQTARLDHAPSAWIERAVAVARGKSVVGRLTKLVARLQFDSWASPAPVVLRSGSGRPARRLGWQADTWSLDLRIEDTPEGWSCTAQVLESGRAQSGIEIRSGAMKTLTDDAGLATWTSARPPRILHATLGAHAAQFGPLSWQPPKSS